MLRPLEILSIFDFFCLKVAIYNVLCIGYNFSAFKRGFSDHFSLVAGSFLFKTLGKRQK